MRLFERASDLFRVRWRRGSSNNAPSQRRFYVGGVAGCYRNYCHSDCAASAGHSEGARGRPAHAVQQQPAPVGGGGAQPCRRAEVFPFRRLGVSVDRRSRPRVRQGPAGRLDLQLAPLHREHAALEDDGRANRCRKANDCRADGRPADRAVQLPVASQRRPVSVRRHVPQYE